jgi:hypothetical protein
MPVTRVGTVLERAAQRAAGLLDAQAVGLGSRQADAGAAFEARQLAEATVPLRVEARQQVAAVAVGGAVVVRRRSVPTVCSSTPVRRDVPLP